ncbi:hypothetical protein WEI85_01355 [Actinomycetes bacterium KLBMP 9797]
MAESEKSVDRRKLLRRGGIVAAGVAGAGVAGAVAATPAQAAPGDNVVAGQTVGAADTTTGIQSNGANAPTLALNNQYEVADGDATAVGPSLQLTPHGDWLKNEAPVGSLAADQWGVPWVSLNDGLGPWSYAVHTQFTSNTIVPVTPTRVVDTRNATGRQYIMNPSGNLDSAGRLLGGRSINIDLTDFAYYPDAVLLNATVVGSVAGGFLTLWAYDTPRPPTSSLNFAGAALSNFVFSAAGWNQAAEVEAGISVFVNTTTHVVLDVVGYVVSVGYVRPSPAAAGQSALAEVNRSAERARLARAGKPRWQK